MQRCRRCLLRELNNQPSCDEQAFNQTPIEGAAVALILFLLGSMENLQDGAERFPLAICIGSKPRALWKPHGMARQGRGRRWALIRAWTASIQAIQQHCLGAAVLTHQSGQTVATKPRVQCAWVPPLAKGHLRAWR